MEVEVEVLDVTEDEARALLLSLDPLAALAGTQEQLQQRLLELTSTPCAELRAVWEATAEETLKGLGAEKPPRSFLPVEQYLIVVTCRDEKHQVELLGRFHEEGLECRVLLS